MNAILQNPPQHRSVVIQALRTPFVKSFGVFESMTPLELSQRVVVELIGRTGVNSADIADIVWGAVVPNTKNANVARDIALFSGLPNTIPGFTLNRACASSLQAIQCASDAIRLGRAEAIIAGGVEVLSAVPIVFSETARRFLTKLSRARSLSEKLQLFTKIQPKSFLPVPPALTEPFTGLTMGESAEIMAVKNKISRTRQDAFALRSHLAASQAVQNGYLKEEIVPIWAGSEKQNYVEQDNIIRADTTLEGLAKLKPAFDKKNGTLTAGNSSALTDGASAALITSYAYAKSNNLPILGEIVDSVTIAVDPKDQLLIGPAFSIPKLLQKHNLKIDDIGIFEIHEAFAAQVLSCTDSMNSLEFCEKKLGLSHSFGAIPETKLNIYGGALAFGHPFGATGSRLVGHALRAARRNNSRYAVVAICAAGGMSQAMLLKADVE